MPFTLPDSCRIKGHSVLTSLCVALALVGCAGEVDLAKALDTAASWQSTARMTAEARRSGAITRTYAVQIDTEAKQALLELRHEVASAEHETTVGRRATASLDSLEQSIHALDAELRR
ncbi:MAG: hypothetical protein ABI601_04495 [bacterium]